MARNPWLLVAAAVGLLGGGTLFGAALGRAKGELRVGKRRRKEERAARVARHDHIEAMAKAGGGERRPPRAPRLRGAPSESRGGARPAPKGGESGGEDAEDGEARAPRAARGRRLSEIAGQPRGGSVLFGD